MLIQERCQEGGRTTEVKKDHTVLPFCGTHLCCAIGQKGRVYLAQATGKAKDERSREHSSAEAVASQ